MRVKVNVKSPIILPSGPILGDVEFAGDLYFCAEWDIPWDGNCPSLSREFSTRRDSFREWATTNFTRTKRGANGYNSSWYGISHVETRNFFSSSALRAAIISGGVAQYLLTVRPCRRTMR